MNPFEFIPAIDLIEGQCVRLRQGDYRQKTVYAQNICAVAQRFEAAKADRIHMVDLDGAKKGCPINTEAVRAVVDAVNIPVEIGGGIRSLQDAQSWFNCGVARIILGTAAVRNPELAEELLARYGAQRVVLGIDARKGCVSVAGWLHDEAVQADALAQTFAQKGFTTLIFTDIDTDGMMNGPNPSMLEKLHRAAPKMNLIASGGVRHGDDVRLLRRIEGVGGVITGRAVYENAALLDEMAAAAHEENKA